MYRIVSRAMGIVVFCVLSINLRGDSSARKADISAIDEQFAGRDPRARWDPSGNLHVTFVREVDGKPRLFYARAGAHPAPPAAIPLAPDGIDANSEAAGSIEVLPDGTLVVVYSVRTGSDEKVHEWDAEIRAQVSKDAGTTWSKPILVHDDGKACSHALVSTAVAPGGDLLVAWLDSRTGVQGLEFARSRDGIHFSRNVRLDDRTCECCGISILPETGGGAWLAYRDLDGKDLRDTSVLHIDGSDRVTAAGPLSRDGWHIDACPDAGPRLALGPDGRIWAAWFTGAATSGVYVGSSGAGATFSRLRLSHDSGSPANHPEIAVLPGGRLAVLFDASTAGGRGIFARLANPDGRSWSPARLVAPNATAARIVLSGRLAALAYTARKGKETLAVVTTGPFREGGALASPSEVGR